MKTGWAVMFLRWLVVSIFRIREEIRWRRNLRRLAPARDAAGGVRIAYAHAGYPAAPTDGFVSGGAVKYIHLHRRWPHAGPATDVIYAVSSSHSPHLEALFPSARARGIKIIWNQDGIHRPGPDTVRRDRNRKMAELYRQADYVFFQSRFCRESAERFLGECDAPCEILYNAVDTRAFTPGKVRTPTEDELRILMAGSHYSDYRVPCGIRALAAVRRKRSARLIVAGRFMPPAYEAGARKLAFDLNLESHVEFRGGYLHGDAPEMYREGDVYLHTKYADPCPSSVIEAMACGLPVVYSATGGTPELVGGKAGIGVPGKLDWEKDIPPDPEALAEAVLKVADHYVEYTTAARERAVACFDIEPWLMRHREIFEQITGKTHG
ncbi:MAG: glycosyltransferase family 4 protein [Planctomycetota bacterium]